MRLSSVLGAVCLTAGLLVGMPARVARADAAVEIELQRSLDAAIESLELSNVELPKVFDDIAAKGKIKLQVDPTCYDLLPYGNTTKVSATFRQSKLRDAIDEILKPLGLEKTVSGDKVLITPTAPLLRIGRRATWDELRILAAARQETLPALTTGNLVQGLRTVLSMDNLQLKDALAAGPEHDAAIEQVKKQLPTEAWKALDIYAASTGQIWFVSENTIEVMTQRQWIGRQLDRRIEIKKTNRPLVECVSELSHLSGIHFTPDPGLYAMFPQVTLNSTGGTVREILDTLRGVIGINYEIRDDSILLKKMSTDPAPAAGARPDPILGQVAIPLAGGGEIMMFIRESQVPPEVAEALKKQVAESIEKIKKSATAPASAPAVNATQGKATPGTVPASGVGTAPDKGGRMKANTPIPENVLGLTLAEFAAAMDTHPQAARTMYARIMRTGEGARLPAVIRREDDGGTVKFCLPAGEFSGKALESESVIIPMTSYRASAWYTLCVSTQIGCRMGCTFCETGKMGLLRNLTAGEIVRQRLVARALRLSGMAETATTETQRHKGPTEGNTEDGKIEERVPTRHEIRKATHPYFVDGIQNIVFMGMGEPLDNFDEVTQAIRVLSEPAGLDFPMTQITVSTVGRIDGLRKLAALKWPNLRIAISLNAASDKVRDELMPINKGMPLADLQRTLLEYPMTRKGRFLVEYVLIKGVNDSLADADAVAEWCRPLPCIVNVIPYNPQRYASFETPSEEAIGAFIFRLKGQKIFTKRRITHGRDLMGACGQLGNPEVSRKKSAGQGPQAAVVERVGVIRAE